MDSSNSEGDQHDKKPSPKYSSGANLAVTIAEAEDARISTESHIPPIHQIDRSRASFTPSTSSAAPSPRLSMVSQYSPRDASTIVSPSDRSLPSRNVNEGNIAETYAAFILYCNPSFPLSTDTTELKRLFQGPPRSDGKNFKIWTLLELLQKFDQKEIKTWSQLVLELGVERPSAEKGQSAQKVQQYSVRLKRWLRAMHVDAFFEFLMGKRHPYFVQIPPAHISGPEMTRDGVPFEEDMALKALNPSLRPKRGRRKNEEGDERASSDAPPRPKRSQLNATSSMDDSGSSNPQYGYPRSAVPQSAHPGLSSRSEGEEESWDRPTMPRSAIEPPNALLVPGTSMANQMNRHLSWRLQRSGNEPTTPHPLSAVTPRTTSALDEAFDEPQSALTPSKGRTRRRHGPAVSSAWHSTGRGSGGKLRGRPPTNRSVQEGPYVTFPANPSAKGKEPLDNSSLHGNPMYALPPIHEREDRHFRFPPELMSTKTSLGHAEEEEKKKKKKKEEGQAIGQEHIIHTRPERLQLQVPQRAGGPVHLVTPTLLLNDQREDVPNISSTASLDSQSMSSTGRGEGRPSSTRRGRSRERSVGSTTRRRPEATLRPTSSLPIPSDADVKRALTADLLRADIIGRKRLTGPEAKLLAEAILRQLRFSQSPMNANAEIRRVICTSWLGMTHLLATDQGPVGSGKTISVHKYRIDRDGYEIPIDETHDESSDDNEDSGNEDDQSMTEPTRKSIREIFDISWTLLLGGLSGQFQLKGLKLSTSSGDAIGSAGNPADDSTAAAEFLATGQDEWKQKWAEVQEALKAKDQELQQLRDQVINAVL